MECGSGSRFPWIMGALSDLRQDFGHASSRNQAAMESSSGFGAMRSKKAAITSAGTLWPVVEWNLRRLWHASMNSITACLAESLVGKLHLQCVSFLSVAKHRKQRISFFSVAKNNSATALSWHLPAQLHEKTIEAKPFASMAARSGFLPCATPTGSMMTFESSSPRPWRFPMGSARPRRPEACSAREKIPGNDLSRMPRR